MLSLRTLTCDFNDFKSRFLNNFYAKQIPLTTSQTNEPSKPFCMA